MTQHNNPAQFPAQHTHFPINNPRPNTQNNAGKASKSVGSLIQEFSKHLFFRGNDLRVPFRMTLLLLSNSRLTADSIQNVLLSELSLLEIQLNNTVIDRSRVHVKVAGD